MKTLPSVIPSVVLCVGLTLSGGAVNATAPGGSFAEETMAQSVASHEAALLQHQDRVGMLQEKIQKLEHRLDMVKNSYRDPKGFKRQSWKRILGNWRGELQGLQERMAWHKEQIAQLKK